ncbi:MAG: hypothetical protein PHC35_09205, partial [Deltaproteobacteria bacterium]|nr:hypothetical protein [Deltaproteobacteria bacterium]
GTPPALVLSQDQTLQLNKPDAQKTLSNFYNSCYPLLSFQRSKTKNTIFRILTIVKTAEREHVIPISLTAFRVRKNPDALLLGRAM